MQVRVLGQLLVSHGDRVWSPSSPKERKLLAVLLLRLGEVVSVDTIADALWDGAPPRSAVKSVQAYVTRLRAALDPAHSGEGVIHTSAPGYRLVMDRADVDANAFTDLLKRARLELDRDEPELADSSLDEAFGLWRGDPYAEFVDTEYFVAEIRRLTETRLAGLELRLVAGLALGRHAELVAEAQALCSEYPLHEGFWVQLVTALYRCGRQADALAALRQVRVLLADEVGADPGVELRSLEQRVLRQDPTLAAPHRPPTSSMLPPELDPAGRLFVGRAAELSWLRQAWADVAADGGTRLLTIAGPRGSGRTRLLGQFAADLHAEGVTIHYGQLGPGLAVLDDVDDRTAVRLEAIASHQPMLCVAAFDPERAGPGVRRALVTAGAEERALPPLSRDEAARLAADVVGSIDADLADEITLAAGYWPGAVERIAIQRVGQRSAQRVIAAVEQAEPASRRLTAARGEVAAGVRDLARIRARQTETAAGRGRVACPYKGLAAYEQGDAPLFFGRDDLVAQLCARLVDTAFVVVVGASGAGKSSLVRAGLLPALADGVLPALVGLPHYLLAPGELPPATDGGAIVVVDQFEEIFFTDTGDAARDRYLDELTSLASRPGTRVIVALRGDFVGACAAHPRLARLVADGTVLVGPMRADEIRHVIEGPARHVGLQPEPALADAIASDVEIAPGALPLLSTALVEVWQRRAGAALTVAAYYRSGGVLGAVARLGEAAYASLDEPTQAAARRLLLRLAETGDGGTMVRRRVARTELGNDAATGRALDVLVARRLLTISDRGVEVTHEALLTRWPRLVGWLAEDERGRQLRRHLAPAALDWEGAGRPDTELYRGARLAAALDWPGDRLVDLTGLERDFLAASRDYSDRELREEIARADREVRGSRRLRAALAAAVALLIVASGAAWVAIDRQRAASDASRQSLARRLGALALVTSDLDRSLLLAVQAVRTHDDWETRGDLLAVLSRSPQALHQVRGASDQGVIQQVALTRDGSTVVAGGFGRLFAWDAETLAPIGAPAVVGDRTESIILGADSHDVFVTVSVDVTKLTQAVIRWDARSGRNIATYPLPDGVTGSTGRLALSADRRVLAVPTLGRQLLLYDLSTRSPPSQVELPEPAGDVWPLGSLLMTASRESRVVRIVDPIARRVVGHVSLPFAGSVVPSPDGRSLLVFAGDRAALVTADDGEPIRAFSGAIRAAATAAFSTDGALVAIGGDDQLVGIWDVATGELRDVLTGHAAPVRGLAFPADGRTVYSVSQDNSVIAWDVAGDQSFGYSRSRAPVLPVAANSGLTTITKPTVAWTGDRSRVYVNVADGSAAAQIDVESGRPVGELRPIAIDPAAASPVADLDRNAGFTTTITGQLRRHNVLTGDVTRTTSAEPPLDYYTIAVSGDGRTLAAELVGQDATGDWRPVGVELRDPETLALRRRLPPLGFIPWYLLLNQDGSLLVATGMTDNRVELWDTRTGVRRWQADIGYRQGSAIAIAADGRTMVVGTLEGGVALLDVADGRVLARHTQRLSYFIASVEFSPDGALVALGGNDGRTHLLTAGTLREVGQLPMATGAAWAFATYHPDGSRLSAVDERGRVVHWDTRPASWIDRACSIVGRDFSEAEWASYLPGVPHQRTCAGG